jgi:DNA-directed RNA polymerase sigma subunit (sigma70/sigma32)
MKMTTDKHPLGNAETYYNQLFLPEATVRERKELAELIIREIYSLLDEKEARVVEMKIWISPPKTNEECAYAINRRVSRVQELKHSALQKLKDYIEDLESP